MANYEEQRNRLLNAISSRDPNYISEIYELLELDLSDNGEEDLVLLADAILNLDEDFLRINSDLADLIDIALGDSAQEEEFDEIAELEKLEEDEEEIDEDIQEAVDRINNLLTTEQQVAIVSDLIANNFVDGDIDENDPNIISQALADILINDPRSLEELSSVTSDGDLVEYIRILLTPVQESTVVATSPVASQQAMYPSTPATPIQNEYQIVSSKAIPQTSQLIQARAPQILQPTLQRSSVGPLQVGTKTFVPAVPQQRQLVQPTQVVQPSVGQRSVGQGGIPTFDSLVTLKLEQLRESLRVLNSQTNSQAKPGRSKATAAEAILGILEQDPSLLEFVPEIANLQSLAPTKPVNVSTKPTSRPTPKQPPQPVIRQQGIVQLSSSFQPSRVGPSQQIVQKQPVTPAVGVLQPRTPGMLMSPATKIQLPTSPLQRGTPSGISLTSIEGIRDAELRDLYKAVTGKKTAPRKKTERALEIYNIVNSGLAAQNILDMVNQVVGEAAPPKTPGKTPRTPQVQSPKSLPQPQPQPQPQAQLVGVPPIRTPLAQPNMAIAQRYINALQIQPASEILSAIQMIVPPGMNGEQYLRDNIVDYVPVLTRTVTGPVSKMTLIQNPNNGVALLSQYTDSELFDTLGVYVPYASRRELVERLANLAVRDSFFVPLDRNCRNETLASGIPSSDPNIEVIGYGTLINYECYDPRTLIEGIVREGEGAAYGMFIVGPNNEEFFGDQIDRLSDLARVYPALSDLYQALNS